MHEGALCVFVCVCVCKLGEIWEALYVEAEYRGTWKNQEDVYLFIVDLPIKKEVLLAACLLYVFFCVLYHFLCSIL